MPEPSQFVSRTQRKVPLIKLLKKHVDLPRSCNVLLTDPDGSPRLTCADWIRIIRRCRVPQDWLFFMITYAPLPWLPDLMEGIQGHAEQRLVYVNNGPDLPDSWTSEIAEVVSRVELRIDHAPPPGKTYYTKRIRKTCTRIRKQKPNMEIDILTTVNAENSIEILSPVIRPFGIIPDEGPIPPWDIDRWLIYPDFDHMVTDIDIRCFVVQNAKGLDNTSFVVSSMDGMVNGNDALRLEHCPTMFFYNVQDCGPEAIISSDGFLEVWSRSARRVPLADLRSGR